MTWQPHRRQHIAVALSFSVCLLPFAACATKKEVISAHSEVARVQGDLQGLESSLAKRQVVMSEELVELKRTVGALKSRDEELRQFLVQLQQRLNINKIEIDENLRHSAGLSREYQEAIEKNIQQMTDKTTAKISGVENGLAEVRRRLEESAAIDNDQNRKLGELLNRLSVFLEETTAENEKLRKALLDLSQSYNQLAEKLNSLNQDVAAFQDKTRREIEAVKALQSKSGARHHVVAEGETLTAIASRYGLSVDELVRLNNLTDPDAVRVGQKLTVREP